MHYKITWKLDVPDADTEVTADTDVQAENPEAAEKYFNDKVRAGVVRAILSDFPKRQRKGASSSIVKIRPLTPREQEELDTFFIDFEYLKKKAMAEGRYHDHRGH